MLNIIFKVFIKEIENYEIRKEVIRKMTTFDKFLKFVYTLTKEVQRTNLKIQKLFDEKLKFKELLFLRNLTQRNMFKSQIDTLITFFNFKISVNQDFK